jgi:hypothetical protein
MFRAGLSAILQAIFEQPGGRALNPAAVKPPTL